MIVKFSTCRKWEIYNFAFLVNSPYFWLFLFCLSLAHWEFAIAVLNFGKKNSIFCLRFNENGKLLILENSSLFKAVSNALILAASVFGNLL